MSEAEIERIIASIKSDLPEFPEDIVASWLAPLALEYGWPPGTDWRYALKGRPISAWRDHVSWTLVERPFILKDFEPLTMLTARGVYEANVLGKQNQFSTVVGTADRLKRCFMAIAETGKFPKPIIVLQAPDGMEIVDGNHRIAAMMMYLHMRDNDLLNEKAAKVADMQSMWIGAAPQDWFADPAKKNPALTWAIMNMPSN